MVEIIVDGENIIVDERGNLIDELKKHNIEIPHFCYHEALGVSGNCRMCLVEVVGQKRPQIACDTPIKAGMELKINSELTRKVQRGLLEMEFINHPLDCPICDQAGECALQEYYMKYDKAKSRVQAADKVAKDKRVDLGAGVVHDAERCVLCRRCVRFTQNCSKTDELGVGGRGEHSHIVLAFGEKMKKDYALNVVDLCPVGAMTQKDFRFKKRVWYLRSCEAICQGCEMGCAIWVDAYKEKYQNDKIYRIRPRYDAAVNGYFMCDYGRDIKENEPRSGDGDFINSVATKIDRLREFCYLNRFEFDIVISSFCSLEEMVAAKNLAKNFGANIYGFDKFFDESFTDESLKLKSPHKSPNAAGLRALKISTDLKNIKNKIIIFDLSGEVELKGEIIWKIGGFADGDKNILAAPAFGKKGTTINKNGVLRVSNKAFDSGLLSVEEIINRLNPNHKNYSLNEILDANSVASGEANQCIQNGDLAIKNAQTSGDGGEA